MTHLYGTLVRAFVILAVVQLVLGALIASPHALGNDDEQTGPPSPPCGATTGGITTCEGGLNICKLFPPCPVGGCNSISPGSPPGTICNCSCQSDQNPNGARCGCF